MDSLREQTSQLKMDLAAAEAALRKSRLELDVMKEREAAKVTERRVVAADSDYWDPRTAVRNAGAKVTSESVQDPKMKSVTQRVSETQNSNYPKPRTAATRPSSDDARQTTRRDSHRTFSDSHSVVADGEEPRRLSDKYMSSREYGGSGSTAKYAAAPPHPPDETRHPSSSLSSGRAAIQSTVARDKERPKSANTATYEAETAINTAYRRDRAARPVSSPSHTTSYQPLKSQATSLNTRTSNHTVSEIPITNPRVESKSRKFEEATEERLHQLREGVDMHRYKENLRKPDPSITKTPQENDVQVSRRRISTSALMSPDSASDTDISGRKSDRRYEMTSNYSRRPGSAPLGSGRQATLSDKRSESDGVIGDATVPRGGKNTPPSPPSHLPTPPRKTAISDSSRSSPNLLTGSRRLGLGSSVSNSSNGNGRVGGDIAVSQHRQKYQRLQQMYARVTSRPNRTAWRESDSESDL